MRIALLHYSAAPVIGGVERVIAEHAELLAAGGHEVTIFCGEGAAPTIGSADETEGQGTSSNESHHSAVSVHVLAEVRSDPDWAGGVVSGEEWKSRVQQL